MNPHTITCAKETFFASANTGNGFQSFFPEIFSPERFSDIYIIKGGPGTGKSTLLRRAAALAEGRGLKVVYYLCSSDVYSLDGITVPEIGVAIIDGTAPHISEPRFPGAVEAIIDIGRFFDKTKLQSRRAEIKRLFGEHRAKYTSAYRYLAAATEIGSEIIAAGKSFINAEKLRTAAEKTIDGIKRGARAESGSSEIKYITSFGPSGYIRLPAPEFAREYIPISDIYMSGYAFTAALAEAAKRAGLSVCLFPEVPDSSLLRAVHFTGADIAFEVCSQAVEVGRHAQSMRRFINSEALRGIRGRLRFARRCRDAALEGALECFGEVRRLHDELENIYSKAVDFAECDEYTDRILKEIFG